MKALIQEIALEVFRANSISIMEATVTKAPPEIEIMIGGNPKDIIKKDLIVTAEHLTRHKRIVTITHDESTVRDLGDGTEKDLLDTDNDEKPYTHFKQSYVEMQFEDVLKVGDKVMVIIFDQGQRYLIVDRMVI